MTQQQINEINEQLYNEQMLRESDEIDQEIEQQMEEEMEEEYDNSN